MRPHKNHERFAAFIRAEEDIKISLRYAIMDISGMLQGNTRQRRKLMAERIGIKPKRLNRVLERALDDRSSVKQLANALALVASATDQSAFMKPSELSSSEDGEPQVLVSRVTAEELAARERDDKGRFKKAE